MHLMPQLPRVAEAWACRFEPWAVDFLVLVFTFSRHFEGLRKGGPNVWVNCLE